MVIMRSVDVMLTIPTIFLILAVVVILEPSIWNIMVVIGLTSWMELPGSSGPSSCRSRNGNSW